MKYNCENEFDLKEIYKKLTTDTCSKKVIRADRFFTDNNLSRLQMFSEKQNFCEIKTKEKM